MLLLACASQDTAKPDDPAGSAPVDTAADPADSEETETETETETDSADSDSAPTETDSDSGEPDPVALSCAAVTEAAQTLLGALSAEQQEAIRFELDDPSRNDWSNLPVPTVPRDGVAIGDMDVVAAAAAWTLLATSLSEAGYAQALDVVALDDLDAADTMLGSEFYTWAIYGEPATDARWAWQFDGHHLVYTFTVECPEVVMAPNLLGASPMTVTEGDLAGLEALGPERDAALALRASLDAEQEAVAVGGSWDMGSLVMGPEVDWAFPDPPEGLPAADMDDVQRGLLYDAIALWVEDQEPEQAALRMAEIEAELDEVHLLWIGGDSVDSLYYFRIQAPTVYIEWDCNESYDHVHAVYRNPVEDYGGDVLGLHHAASPHPWILPR